MVGFKFFSQYEVLMKTSIFFSYTHFRLKAEIIVFSVKKVSRDPFQANPTLWELLMSEKEMIFWM